MPCIWGKHDRSQAFLNIAILGQELIERVRASDAAGTPYNLPVFRALIDTGSQATCISREVAAQIGLKPVGKIPIRGVAGVSYHNNYLFLVGFPIGAAQSTGGDSTMNLHISTQPVEGIEMTVGGDFDVLLGMDIIGLGSLKIDGDGSFSFSF